MSSVIASMDCLYRKRGKWPSFNLFSRKKMKKTAITAVVTSTLSRLFGSILRDLIEKDFKENE